MKNLGKNQKKKIKNISQLQSGATAPSNPRNVLVNNTWPKKKKKNEKMKNLRKN